MAKLISKTYGEALFELAVEQNKLDTYKEEIEFVKEVLADNPEFSKLMNHPKILKEEKKKVLENIFSSRISQELVGFLTLIVTKDRYNELDAILDYFITKVKEEKGIGVAFVTTASEVRKDQTDKIEAKLLETTKYQTMEMHYQIDESLIGGMVIRIGDRVVDSSIKTKLYQLEKELKGLQIS